MPDNTPPVQCPGWMRGEVNKMLNRLNGEHDEVIVAAAAALGPEGFDIQSCEQTTNFDPNEYGPVMLEGYSMIAGAALAKTLGTVYAATQSEQHFTQDIEDPTERLQAIRNLYEQAIREFLTSVLTYAGSQFQAEEGREANMSMAAGSQLIDLWRRIAESPITFKGPSSTEPGQSKEQSDETGPQHGE